MDPKKVQAIAEAPRPNDVTQVRAFVGMVNYYGRFIRNLPEILEPLYQLLKRILAFSGINAMKIVSKKLNLC